MKFDTLILQGQIDPIIELLADKGSVHISNERIDDSRSLVCRDHEAIQALSSLIQAHTNAQDPLPGDRS